MIENTENKDAETLVNDLIDLLSVQRMADGWYLGKRKKNGVGRVFGGQVLAQALASAQHSVAEGRIAHSLHAYFMRPGSEDYEITYRVERDFDGGSFSTRRVIALQQDKPILNMAASFQKYEQGLDYQSEMPVVPAPDTLLTDLELRKKQAHLITDQNRQVFLRERPFEYRPCEPRDRFTGEKHIPAQQNIWFKLRHKIGDDAALHRAMLVYASDSWLLGTSTLPHGVHWETPGFQSASLDHAVWIHDDFRIDEWLLYVCDCPWTGRGRGFNRGGIYSQDGRLVATCAQEGLVRMRVV
jgi:acyl-CoA thioesterase II